MKPVVVSDILAVGEFPSAEQLAILAKAGFKAVLNNQPDGEVARFQAGADVEAEAKRHGLAYAYAPLTSRTPPGDELARYAQALSSLPSPIYAFCYSGSRSAAACALLLTDRMDVEAIVKEFGEAGFDLSGLRPWLDDERARRAPKPVANAQAAVATALAAVTAHAPAVTVNGSNGHADEKIAAPPMVPVDPQVRRPDGALGLPRMIVVQPRAAGYGGFAV